MTHRSVFFLMVLLAAGLARPAMAAPPPEVTQEQEVHLKNQNASQPFKVDGGESIHVLRTTTSDAFVKDSGKVIASARHAAATWQITQNTIDLCEAKSPPLKKNEGSWVVCEGQFIPQPGLAQGRGGSEKKVPEWRSALTPSGTGDVHVVLVNFYTDRDNTFESGFPYTTNDAYQALAFYYKQQLAGSGQNTASSRVILCYLGGPSEKFTTIAAGVSMVNTRTLKGLKDFLAANIQTGEKIASFTWQGHGGTFERIATGNFGILLAAKPFDPQLRVQESDEVAARDPYNFEGNEYAFVGTLADAMKPHLKDDAVVNLYACHTADGEPPVGSFLKGKLPDTTTVIGIKGLERFSPHYDPEAIPENRLTITQGAYPEPGGSWVTY